METGVINESTELWMFACQKFLLFLHWVGIEPFTYKDCISWFLSNTLITCLNVYFYDHSFMKLINKHHQFLSVYFWFWRKPGKGLKEKLTTEKYWKGEKGLHILSEDHVFSNGKWVRIIIDVLKKQNANDDIRKIWFPDNPSSSFQVSFDTIQNREKVQYDLQRTNSCINIACNLSKRLTKQVLHVVLKVETWILPVLSDTWEMTLSKKIWQFGFSLLMIYAGWKFWVRSGEHYSIFALYFLKTI